MPDFIVRVNAAEGKLFSFLAGAEGGAGQEEHPE